MGNGCFAEFCCCVPLCPCELRYSSSKDISFRRFPGDKVAGRECIFKSRRVLGGTCIATDNACKLVINLIFNTIIYRIYIQYGYL